MSEQSPEWGERRRRREEERLRALAAQEAAVRQGAGQGLSPAPGGRAVEPSAPPQHQRSRRELREQADIAAAKIAPPAAQPARQLSRREIRAAATGESVPVVQAPQPQRPVVSPPARPAEENRRPASTAGQGHAATGTPPALSPQARAAAIRAQAARAQAEREEQSRVNAERAQAQRQQSQRAEQDRAEQDRAEQDRAEQDRAEQDRAEQDRLRRAEQERLQQKRAEHERFQQQRVEHERTQQRFEQERAQLHRAEQERVVQARSASGVPTARDGRGQDAASAAGSGRADQPGRPQPSVRTHEAVRPQEAVRASHGAASEAAGQHAGTRPARPWSQGPAGTDQPGQSQARVMPSAPEPAGQGGMAADGRRAPEPTAFVPAGRIPRLGETFGSVSLRSSTMPTPGALAPGPRADGAGSSSEAMPRWSSISPTTTAWSPGAPHDGTVVLEAGQADADAEADADAPTVDLQKDDADGRQDAPRAHPYTWLHMIVLVLVAFVLGMLIFMIVMNDAGPGSEAAADGQVAEPRVHDMTRST